MPCPAVSPERGCRSKKRRSENPAANYASDANGAQTKFFDAPRSRHWRNSWLDFWHIMRLNEGGFSMTYRFLVSMCCLAAVIAISWLPGSSLGQAPAKTWTPPHTPDGQPEIQGTWSFATITPLERPADLAGKEFFTEKEAAEYEKDVVLRNNKDRRDGSAEADVGRAYNDFWWDSGTKVVKTRRTSLVIDPPDGRIPPLTPAARERQAERAAQNRGHEFDGPENRPLPERCLVMQGSGPPILPTAYNNNTQIVQGPGYVAILIEMGHETRVIPLDGRPHLPKDVRLWKGDSRGHWEGETLVVETTNFTNKSAFRGTSENMRLIERFRRMDANTLLYQFTVEDPATFAKPWTVEIPVPKSEGRIFEYACHEGNYGMFGALAGARAEEKKAAANRDKSSK